MVSLADLIIEEAKGEEILGVVVGPKCWWAHCQPNDILKGRLLSWEVVKDKLLCSSAVYCWTATRVLFAVEYDGMLTINSVPRQPQHLIPEIFGES